jgi:hypothetical protein
VRVLRGQPVLDRDHDRADLVAEQGGGRVLTGDVAEDHPAAVDEVDAGQGAGGVARPVDPYGDVGVADRPRHRPVLLDHVRVLRHLDGAEQRLDGGAALDDVRDGVETTGQGLEQTLQRYGDLRVDQMTSGHGCSPSRIVRR